MADTLYDVAIIGAGPGGYVAAIRAGQLAMKTVLIERGDLGGVCLNVGCIPTRAVLHAADLLDQAREARQVGIAATEMELDWRGVMHHKHHVVAQLRRGIAHLLRKHGVDVVPGLGRLVSPTSVSVSHDGGSQAIRARNILVATGSTPNTLPVAPIDEDTILSNTGALALSEVPRRLVIIGGGVVGAEFGSAFRSFGTDVTIIEVLPRLVPAEDEEISAELARSFRRRGIKLHLAATVGGVVRGKDGVAVTFTDHHGQAQHAVGDKLLLAVGRTPLTRDLGLEEVGIKTDQSGAIVVNGVMQTNVPTVYSVGDCIPRPGRAGGRAYLASAEGILAIEHMAGRQVEPISYDKVPVCTYCAPEIGSSGLTEATAQAQGFAVKVGRFPFAANARALVVMNRRGFVKIVADAQSGEVLGVHIIGPGATEMIGEGVLALTHEATATSLVRTIHAHPTLYEALGEAAHGLFEGPINS